MILILNEPKGENYEELIQLAFDRCDTFLFIKHSQLTYFQSFDILLEELKDDFICRKVQNEWPGTRSVPTAMVYYFRTSEKSRETVKKITDSLFNWQAPYLPDDLCFLRNNKEWLVTTAHEHYCHIQTENQFEILQLQRINGLIERIDREFPNHNMS